MQEKTRTVTTDHIRPPLLLWTTNVMKPEDQMLNVCGGVFQIYSECIFKYFFSQGGLSIISDKVEAFYGNYKRNAVVFVLCYSYIIRTD